MTNVRYSEGDWFAVPIRSGGFAIGVIARANPGGVLLGYFFGPKRAALPKIEELARLTAADAVLVGKFGHLGIKQNRWPIVGRFDTWDRREWPMPALVRYEELTGRTFRVIYDDDDPNRFVREERLTPDEVSTDAPKDGLMGPGFAEAILTRLLEKRDE
jgi:Immunity protein 26